MEVLILPLIRAGRKLKESIKIGRSIGRFQNTKFRKPKEVGRGNGTSTDRGNHQGNDILEEPDEFEQEVISTGVLTVQWHGRSVYGTNREQHLEEYHYKAGSFSGNMSSEISEKIQEQEMHGVGKAMPSGGTCNKYGDDTRKVDVDALEEHGTFIRLDISKIPDFRAVE